MNRTLNEKLEGLKALFSERAETDSAQQAYKVATEFEAMLDAHPMNPLIRKLNELRAEIGRIKSTKENARAHLRVSSQWDDVMGDLTAARDSLSAASHRMRFLSAEVTHLGRMR